MHLEHAINAEPAAKASLEAIPQLEAFITTDLIKKKLIKPDRSEGNEETVQERPADVLPISKEIG